MYNSNNVAEAIKAVAKKKGISMRQLLADVGLGRNTMANFKTSMPRADNLARIADYLGCSVDYLLGREYAAQPNEPQIKKAPIQDERANLFFQLDEEDKQNVYEYMQFKLTNQKYGMVIPVAARGGGVSEVRLSPEEAANARRFLAENYPELSEDD